MAGKAFSLSLWAFCIVFSCLLVPLTGLQIDNFLAGRYLQANNFPAVELLAFVFTLANTLGVVAYLACFLLCKFNKGLRLTMYAAAVIAGLFSFFACLHFSLQVPLLPVAWFSILNLILVFIDGRGRRLIEAS